MFVANRFDAVPQESREKVKSHILKQLGKFWPQFDESMTVFFSTKKAQSDIDANPEYVNAEYKALLEALGSLFSTAIDRRIRSSYKYVLLYFYFKYLRIGIANIFHLPKCMESF